MNTKIRISITDEEKETLDVVENGVLLRILNDAMKIHLMNLTSINEDFLYYCGLLPFKKEDYYTSFTSFNGETIDVEKIAKQNIGYAKYICDTSASIAVGRSPTIALSDPNETEKKALTKLNSKLAYRDWNKSLSDAIHSSVVCGVGYRLIHNKAGDEFPRFSKLDSRTTFVIYDGSIEPESVAGVFYSKFSDNNYHIYVYTDKFMYSFVSSSLGSFNSFVNVTKVPHYFGRVPITEYDNNEYLVGDARPAYGAIGLTCMAQNDIVKGNHDKVKTLLVLKNVTVGSSEEQEKANNLFKLNRMLTLDGENSDAKYINPQIDDTSANENVKRVDNEIWMTSRIVNFNDPDFAQNSSEPALKLKMKGMIDLIQEKEKYISPSIKREIKMVLSYLDYMGNTNITKMDITKLYVVFNHPLPSNDQEKATILQILNNMDYFNPELLRQLSFMYDDLETYLKGVVKRPLQVQQSQAQGNNLNNQQKQEEAKTLVGADDNKKNFLKGEANTLPK